jgi:hypothetical protein
MEGNNAGNKARTARSHSSPIGYVFNLSTKGYATGTYTLNFTAGADSQHALGGLCSEISRGFHFMIHASSYIVAHIVAHPFRANLRGGTARFAVWANHR